MQYVIKLLRSFLVDVCKVGGVNTTLEATDVYQAIFRYTVCTFSLQIAN